MRHIYSFLLYLLTPYLFLRLWWKGRQLPGYRERILERFSLDRKEGESVEIWVHAVSLGEVIAVTPLIDNLLDKQYKILITTMTPTGAERVRQRFGTKVTHRYVPYDLPWVVKKFYRKIKPKAAIFVETELWPNLGYFASKAKIPLFLVNARLSERSYQGYKKAKWLFKPLLEQFDYILAQADDDAKRFKALGAPEDKVQVFGNMKFDLQTQDIDVDKFTQLKKKWGENRVVLILASTHDNEEEQILHCLKKLQEAIPNMLLLIAPRHPERFQRIYQLCLQMGFRTGLRSNLDSLSSKNEVVVLDSLGELLGWYQLSNYAFVGGSLVPVGGHNMLEPIAMGVPVFNGPHVHNFKTICNDLKDAGAIELVVGADDLVNKIIRLHKDEDRKNTLVKNATQVLVANKGTVREYAETIHKLISEP